jgi:hypothetical protein
MSAIIIARQMARRRLSNRKPEYCRAVSLSGIRAPAACKLYSAPLHFNAEYDIDMNWTRIGLLYCLQCGSTFQTATTLLLPPVGRLFVRSSLFDANPVVPCKHNRLFSLP